MGHATEHAKEAAGSMADKAKEAASAVGDMVSNAASNAGAAISKTADRMTNTAGSSVKQLGETIKQKGPQGGVFGSATKAVGDTIQEGGRYLEEEGLSGMMDDVTELVRRNPIPAVFLGIGLGFLIGRTLRS